MMLLQLHQWMQIYVICLHTLFLHLHYTETALSVHPENTVVFVGQSVILKCSTTLDYPVDWLFEKVGSSQTKTVYQGSSPNDVEAGYLIIRESSGQYDLKIRNVQIENAGTYTCVDESGVGEKQLAELTVIVSDPVCNSNMSLKEVTVKNDCDVEPDYLGLSCTVQHKSNIHPELMWRNVKTGDVYRDASKTEKIDSTEYRITVKAVYGMNGTRYSCTVVGLSPSNIGTGTCRTQEIRILYLFNSSIIREVPADNFFMTCSANTTQECEYRWIDRSSFIEVRNRSIRDSIRLPPGNYQCIADCRYRDKTCTVMPTLIKIVNNDSSHHRFIAVITGLIVILLLIVFAIVALWRIKTDCSHVESSSRPIVKLENPETKNDNLESQTQSTAENTALPARKRCDLEIRNHKYEEIEEFNDRIKGAGPHHHNVSTSDVEINAIITQNETDAITHDNIGLDESTVEQDTEGYTTLDGSTRAEEPPPPIYKRLNFGALVR